MTGRPARPIRRVVIAGGGTAGWMTAAALSKLSKAGKIEITLIESETIGTVGVGEATIPPIRNFNSIIGIDEHEFVAKTGATFKLGIEFTDWLKAGQSYLHPFGKYGRDVDGIHFYQLWLKYRKSHNLPDIETYCLSAAAARAGKYLRPSADPQSVLSTLAYAYHFDAGLYATYLRALAEGQEVKRVEGRISTVAQHATSGFITHLELEDGRQIEGDFFIDCTGFRALLIGETLGVDYQDWSHWLPCNRAVTVGSTPSAAPVPYTRATAREAGWQWRIPLQHRTGNGHVFCDSFTTQEAATDVLLANLGGAQRGEIRALSFTTGLREKFWEKNCVAIGLSSGFLEPLESTSIHLIQTGIAKLIALFPDISFNPAEATQYNALMTRQFTQIRDFLILHYNATERIDNGFWQYVRTMSIPDSLTEKVDLFASKGRIFRFDDDLFDVSNWFAVLWGQGIRPRSYDPMVDTLSETDVLSHIREVHDVIETVAKRMPLQQAYIDRYCRYQPIESAF